MIVAITATAKQVSFNSINRYMWLLRLEDHGTPVKSIIGACRRVAEKGQNSITPRPMVKRSIRMWEKQQVKMNEKPSRSVARVKRHNSGVATIEAARQTVRL